MTTRKSNLYDKQKAIAGWIDYANECRWLARQKATGWDNPFANNSKPKTLEAIFAINMATLIGLENNQMNQYMDRAQQWFKNCAAKHMFANASAVSITAVAEYMANQEGTSLWGGGPQIIPDTKIGSHCEGELRVSYERICEVLGPPNMDDDESKVKHSWGYRVDGEPIAIWDYYGHEWSYYGNADTLRKLFGNDAVKPNS